MICFKTQSIENFLPDGMKFSIRILHTFKRIIVVKDTPAPWYTGDSILVISVYDFLLNADSLDM